jgi:hypothetical protein
MKRSLTRILIGCGITVLAAGAYTFYRGTDYYQRSLVAENSRLRQEVESEFEQIQIATGSTLIYEEIDASRICKTATMTKLFATNMLPADICTAISALNIEVLKCSQGCTLSTTPVKRAPIDQNKPSYQWATFSARLQSGIEVSMVALPNNAWGSLFMLSTHGTQEAIPLAKKAGSTFFTIQLKYFEDLALFARHCSEARKECDCVPSTLFAWKFANGRQHTRSD